MQEIRHTNNKGEEVLIREFFEEGSDIQTKMAEMSARVASSIEAEGGQVKEIKTKRKIGRNDSCPCGSGKKFKRCCIHKLTGD